jgi:hypothetical protein
MNARLEALAAIWAAPTNWATLPEDEGVSMVGVGEYGVFVTKHPDGWSWNLATHDDACAAYEEGYPTLAEAKADAFASPARFTAPIPSTDDNDPWL